MGISAKRGLIAFSMQFLCFNIRPIVLENKPVARKQILYHSTLYVEQSEG